MSDAEKGLIALVVILILFMGFVLIEVLIAAHAANEALNIIATGINGTPTP